MYQKHKIISNRIENILLHIISESSPGNITFSVIDTVGTQLVMIVKNIYHISFKF